MGRGSGLVVMLLLAACAAVRPARGADPASLPDSQLGVRIAPLLLLSRADVQTDLKMTRTQVDEATEALLTLRARAAQLVQAKGLPREKLLEAKRAIDADQQHWLESRLSDAQRKRIVQIDLQWEGPAALVIRPALSEMLDLTAEQRVGLRKAVDEALRRRGAGEGVLAVESKLSQEALRILTRPQQERWREILGPPFQPRLAGASPGAGAGTARR